MVAEYWTSSGGQTVRGWADSYKGGYRAIAVTVSPRRLGG